MSIDTPSVPDLRRERCRGSSLGAVNVARDRGKPTESYSVATQPPRWRLRSARRWRELRPLATRTLILTIMLYVADLAGARTAWAGIITPESGGSSNADSIEGLYRIVLIIAALIFCAVAGTLVYFLVKYRARRGHAASQVRGNTRLELAWTGAAALILVVLAVLTFSRLHGVVTPAASADDAAGAVFATVDQPAAPGGHALHIKITGRQFVWRFEYPNGAYSYEELVVPIGTTVVADIYSADVNHSWWVPKLGGKFDAIPAMSTTRGSRSPRPDVHGPVRRAVRPASRADGRHGARDTTRGLGILAGPPKATDRSGQRRGPGRESQARTPRPARRRSKTRRTSRRPSHGHPPPQSRR